MTRRVHASASASSSGREAALARAEQKIQTIIAREQDPVACPKCGHFQKAMTWTVRRHHLGWMRKVAIAVVPLAPVAGLMMLIVAGSETSHVVRMLSGAALWIMPTGLLLALFLLLLRWLLTRHFDLNAASVDTSRWTDGVPHPLDVAGEPVPDTGAPDGAILTYASHGKPWVRLQPLTWTPPPICCSCLKQNDRTSRVYITSACYLNMNLCAACRRRLNLRRLGMAAIAIGILQVPLIWFLRPYVDSMGSVLVVVAAVFAWMAYIVYRVTLPVRFRRIRDHDNTVEIRFRNAAYMHDVLQRVASPAQPATGERW